MLADMEDKHQDPLHAQAVSPLALKGIVSIILELCKRKTLLFLRRQRWVYRRRLFHFKMQQSTLKLSFVEFLLWRSLSRYLSPRWIPNDSRTAFQALPSFIVAAGHFLFIPCNVVDLLSIFHFLLWRYSLPCSIMNLQAERYSPHAGWNFDCFVSAYWSLPE